MTTDQNILSHDSIPRSDPELSNKTTPVRDARRLTSAVAISLVLTSIRSVFVFHVLGPALMGAWKSAAVVDTVHEAARMGVLRALAIRVPVLDGAGRTQQADEIISESGSVMFWLGFVLAGIIFTSSFFFVNPDLRVAMRWMAALAVVTEPYVFLRELAAARHRFELRFRETLYRALVEFSAAILLCPKFKLVGLGGGMVLGVSVTAAYLYCRQTVQFRLRPRVGAVKQLLLTGAPVSLSEAGYEFIRRIDVVIMVVLLGPIFVGYYGISRLVTDFSTVLCQKGIAQVLSPHLLHTYGRTGSILKTARYFEHPARLFSYTVPPLVGAGTFFVGNFVHLLLPQYIPGIIAAQITMWTIFFVALHSSVGSFAVALDLIPVLLRIYVVLIPVTAAAQYTILRRGFGLEGSAWGTLVILAAIGMAEVALAKRKCGNTGGEICRFIATLYFPVAFAMYLKHIVGGMRLGLWFMNHPGTLAESATKALIFLLLFAPILAVYEVKFSLLRTVHQAS
ncbi:MAG: oligosaccharide flippase family protein [Bryobacteraceae bacterium]